MKTISRVYDCDMNFKLKLIVFKWIMSLIFLSSSKFNRRFYCHNLAICGKNETTLPEVEILYFFYSEMNSLLNFPLKMYDMTYITTLAILLHV